MISKTTPSGEQTGFLKGVRLKLQQKKGNLLMGTFSGSFFPPQSKMPCSKGMKNQSIGKVAK